MYVALRLSEYALDTKEDSPQTIVNHKVKTLLQGIYCLGAIPIE